MEALLLFAVVIGIIAVIIAVSFYARLWSTLGEVRRASNALHQELSWKRLEREQRHQAGAGDTLGQVPPQGSPHKRWSLPGDEV